MPYESTILPPEYGIVYRGMNTVKARQSGRDDVVWTMAMLITGSSTFIPTFAFNGDRNPITSSLTGPRLACHLHRRQSLLLRHATGSRCQSDLSILQVNIKVITGDTMSQYAILSHAWTADETSIALSR